MTELLGILVFLLGIGSSMGAFFVCYEKIVATSEKNFKRSFELYERNDLWRKNNSPGLLKQH